MSYPDPPNLGQTMTLCSLSSRTTWTGMHSLTLIQNLTTLLFRLKISPSRKASLFALPLKIGPFCLPLQATASHGAPTAMVTKAISPAVVESSASPQLITTSNTITQNQTKRGMQDFLSFFPIDGNSECSTSKRQAFSPDRRIEVAKVRKIKACQRCKMRKLSWQADGACRNCIRSVAENVALGEQICFRYTLVDLRFGAGDLLRRSQSKDAIEKLPRQMHPNPQIVFVWFRTEYIHQALRLEVQDYSESPDDKDELITSIVPEAGSNQSQFSSLATPKYVIINQSVPSVALLNNWIQQQVDRRKPGQSPAARLFNSFHILLDIHHKTTTNVHSKEFSKAALQITNLYECWRNVLSADKLQLETPTSYISRAAGIQLALVAKQGIADCEIHILSSLDSLIRNSKRPSKETELSIWAGVWTLVLLYRDILRWYLHVSRSRDSAVFKYETSTFLPRWMYNALTSTYNLIFRTKSPLDIDWKEEENFTRIGRNTELRVLLSLIREQIQAMYDQPFDLGENDHIPQCLMAEQSLSPPSLILAHGDIGETSVSYVSKPLVASGGGGGGSWSWGGGEAGYPRPRPRPQPCSAQVGSNRSKPFMSAISHGFVQYSSNCKQNQTSVTFADPFINGDQMLKRQDIDHLPRLK